MQLGYRVHGRQHSTPLANNRKPSQTWHSSDFVFNGCILVHGLCRSLQGCALSGLLSGRPIADLISLGAHWICDSRECSLQNANQTLAFSREQSRGADLACSGIAVRFVSTIPINML